MVKWDHQGDETDRAQAEERHITDAHIALHKKRAAEFIKGAPGECDWCGDYFVRLVNGACGRCSDEYKIK